VVKLPADEAESRRVFEFAKKMKLETIVSEPPTEALDVIEKLVNEYGINMAIHNHPAPSLYADCQAVHDAVEGGERRSGRVPIRGTGIAPACRRCNACRSSRGTSSRCISRT
jgi:hypothetical protein